MRRRRLTALVLVAVAATAVAVGFPGAGPGAPAGGVLDGGPPVPRLLGIVARDEARLVRLDPATLRPRPGARVRLGAEGCAPRSGGQACSMVPPWSFSPDRSRLAVARHEGGVVEALRLVDVRRMRSAGEIPIRSIGTVGLVAWPSPERLLAVQEVCCDERQQLLVADVDRRRVMARRALGGTVQAVGRTARELVLLLAPPKRIGPARLAVVDGAGDVRFVALDRVHAGAEPLEDVDFGLRQRRPGLAVDAPGRRAFVAEDGVVAEVDLADGAVAYHSLTERRSLAARVRDLLDPPAYAKGVIGPTRSAHWLGDGWLAVTGADEQLTEPRLRPAGLRLIDTRDWTYRVIDEGASDVRVAGGLLLATGAQLDGEDTIGLVAYGLDGDRRFSLFADRQPWVHTVVDGRAFVDVGVRPDGSLAPLRVVDLARGRVTGERAGPLPELLLEPARSWWDG